MAQARLFVILSAAQNLVVHAAHKKAPQPRGHRYVGPCRCFNVYPVAASPLISKTEVPSGTCRKSRYYTRLSVPVKVGDPGLEPGASPLSEECSNQLS